MNYINAVCDGCGKPFNETDNIVVCPVCGTPQHRECWDKNNCCVNQSRHSEGFDWAASKADLKKEKADSPAQGKDPGNIQQEKRDSLSSDDKTDKKDIPIAKTLFGPPLTENQLEETFLHNVKIPSTDSIDNISVSDAAMYLQTSAGRYINRFSKAEKNNRKLTWNWAGFFFGPCWLFFRKLFKQAFVFMLVVIMASLVLYPTMTSCYDTIKEVYAAEFKKIDNKQTVTPDEMMATLSKGDNYAKIMHVFKIFAATFLGLGLLPNIFCALFGDYFIKKKMKKDITEIRQGSKEEPLVKISIIRKGGVSTFACLIYILVAGWGYAGYFTVAEYLINIFNWIKELF